MCKKWFVDKEASFTSWGPSDVVSHPGLYNSNKIVLQNTLKGKLSKFLNQSRSKRLAQKFIKFM